MSKRNFLSKLLSGVCCLAMLVTMLPIIPAAAADPGAVLFEDNFNSYTANADMPLGAANKFKLSTTQVRKDAATPGSYKVTAANGAMRMAATDCVDSGDQAEVFVGVATNTTFSGSYTVTFDWMQETEDVYCTIVYVAGTEVRVRMQNPGNASALYNTAFFVDGSNQYLKDPNSGSQFKFGSAFGTWYTFEYFVDADANSTTLNIYDKSTGDLLATHTVKKAPEADKPLEIRQFSVQDTNEVGKTTACYIDNVKVVSGIVETDRQPAAVTGTTISGGAMSNFSDAAEITYTKAVEVTAGLKLFEGADGKFMPKDTVTRAQMATIIVKMLYGSDVNADSFKGAGKFNDIASFEGGWAEGYINWCSTLGIVAGYGDGTFRPGNPVTTAEAATMILNALKVDAGQGTWPVTVMAKSEELDMFDDLQPKPASDKALAREELAVMALVGLEYSPEGKQGYEYKGVVYDSFMDAYMVAGAANADQIKTTQGDSLAGTVYEMKTLEGFITGNQATGLEVTEINGSSEFAIETGLEHIGHYVTVYYAEEYESEDEPGVTYTIYDETKVVTVADEPLDTSKEYKAAFGKNYSVSDALAYFDGQYVMSEETDNEIVGYVAGSYAPMGTYFIYEGKIVAYMEPVEVYATKVLAVETTKGHETIELNLPNMPPISNSEDDDRVVEYKGISEDDYVTYTLVGSEADPIYVLAKAKPVTGTVTKTGTNSDGELIVTVKGSQYALFVGENTTGLKVDVPSDFNANYTFYVTADGKYVGYETNAGAADLTNSVFILGSRDIIETDSYGKKVQKSYARGVDMDGTEVMLLYKIQEGTYESSTKTFTPSGEPLTEQVDTIAAGFYKLDDAVGKDAKKENLKVLTAISATYDEETNPVYTGRSNIGNGKTVSPYNFDVSGMLVNRNTAAPYLMLEGTAEQSTPLTATVKKGSWATFINETGATLNRYLLLSRADNGTAVLEAMVMVATGDVAPSSSTTVYISAQNTAEATKTADGFEYPVYNYKTGAVEKVLFNTDIVTAGVGAPGFYKIADVEGESYKQVIGMVDDIWESGAGVNRDTATDRQEEDGLYNENIFMDEVFQYITNNELSTTDLASKGSVAYTDSTLYRGQKADGAIVIDTRSEEDIEAFGLGKITDLARVESLTDRNEDLIIIMDICYDTSGNKILTVFIKDVYYADSDGISVMVRNGTVYINGLPVADNCQIADGRTYSQPVETLDGLVELAANAQVTGMYLMTDGKISMFTITSVREEGVFVVDDYERYDDGDLLTLDLAASKEIYYANINKATASSTKGPSATIKAGIAGADGQCLELHGGNTTSGSSRQYLFLGIPEGGYSLEFDIMRPNKGYMNIKVVDGVEFRIHYDNNKIFLYGATGNPYIKDNSGADIVIADNEWYHFNILVSPSGILTARITDPDGVEHIDQVDLGDVARTNVTFDAITVVSGGKTYEALNYIDNLSMVAWEDEFIINDTGVTVEKDGEDYTLDNIPVSDTVVITDESGKGVNTLDAIIAQQTDKAVCAEYYTTDGEVTQIIVTSVTLKLPGQLLYLPAFELNGSKLASNVEGWVLIPVGYGAAAGQKVTVPAGTTVTYKSTSGAYRMNGSPAMYTCSADGDELVLVADRLNSGVAKDQKGRHNAIVSFEDGVLQMADAHSYYKDTWAASPWLNCLDGSPCYSYPNNRFEAPLTLTGLSDDQVVYTDNGQTTLGAVAAITDKEVVLDYFLDEDGDVVFMYLFDNTDDHMDRYVPAAGDLLYFPTERQIKQVDSRKGADADAIVVKSDTLATGTQVRVRYLDIFGVDGAAATTNNHLPAGLYACSYPYEDYLAITLQAGTELTTTQIAALTSGTVLDLRTDFTLEAKIEDVAALKTVNADPERIVSADIYEIGGEQVILISNVTTPVLINDNFDHYDDGALTVDIAKSKGVNYSSFSKTGNATLTVESNAAGASSKVAKLASDATTTNSRQYMNLANPDGAYNLQYDLMRPDPCGVFDVSLGKIGSTTIKLRIRGNNNRLGVYGLDGSNTYYFCSDNTTNTSGTGAIEVEGEGNWYHFDITVTATSITVKTTAPGGTTYTHQIQTSEMTFATVVLDSLLNSNNQAINYIDNLKLTVLD